MEKIKNYAIVGLGLMGASLAIALKNKNPKASVYAISRSSEKIFQAKKKNIIDDGFTNLRNLIANVKIDIFFIATPVGVIKKIIQEIDECLDYKAIVTDLGSTKEELEKWSNSKSFTNITYIGSHPMAGSHENGLDAAKENLYDNTICFIVKNNNTNRTVLNILKQIWTDLNVEIVEISAREHDKIVSKISHLPHLIAILLVKTALDDKINCEKYIGSGFLDTTRIAQSDSIMWTDIFFSNVENLKKDLIAYRNAIDLTLKMLETNDYEAIKTTLNKVNEKRKGLIR